jgi:hypothetical protein
MTSKTSRRVSQTPAIAIDRSQQEECYISQRQCALAARAQCKGQHKSEVSHAYLPALCCLLFIIDDGQRGPGAAARQADALRREGVEVQEDTMGQYTIDLGRYGWFPETLPSESGQVESSDEEDEEAAAYHT